MSFCKTVFPCDITSNQPEINANNIIFSALATRLLQSEQNDLRKATVNLPFRQNPASITCENIKFVQFIKSIKNSPRTPRARRTKLLILAPLGTYFARLGVSMGGL